MKTIAKLIFIHLFILLAVPFQNQAQTFNEIKKIIASDDAASDEYGFSVDIHGDYAVVGSRGDDDNGSNSGSAYIYYRNQGGTDNWGQVKKITASDGVAGDQFGFDVSIWGDNIVVGAHVKSSYTGAVYVFNRNQGGTNNWGQVKKITASDAGAAKAFGLKVELDSATLVVGANEHFFYNTTPYPGFYPVGPGSAYVFEQNQGGTNNWGQVKKVTPSDGVTGDAFGYLDVDGDYLVVASHFKNSYQGAVYIFYRNQGGTNNWGQVKKIVPPISSSIPTYGLGIDVSGDNLAVGSYYESGGGYVYVYSRNQGGTNNWGQVKKFKGSTVSSGYWFGTSVTMENDILVVGAAGNGSSGGNGQAYVFKQNQGGTNNWGQTQILTASDGAYNDQFGFSLGMNQGRIIVGAVYNDDGGTNSGSAYIFENCFSSTPTSINATVNPICQGNSTTLSVVGGSLGTGATWEWYTGSCGGTPAGSGSSIIVSPSSNTTYYVRAEGSCNTTTCASLLVNVTAYSPANNTTSTTAICETSTKTLTGTPGGGSWSIVSGGGSITGTTYTPAGPFIGSPGQKTVTIRYTIPASGPCPSSFDDVTFTVYENPGTANNTTSTASICLTDTKTLIGTPSGGTWNVISGGGSITGTTYTPAGPFLGPSKTVTIRYTIAANGVCAGSTDDVMFTVYDSANADWINPINVCESQGIISLPTLLQPYATTGGVWSGTGVTGNNFDPSGLAGTSVTIKYVVGIAPCNDSVSHTFSIDSNVNATWTSPGNICESSGVIDLDTTLDPLADTGGVWSGTGVTGSIFDPSGLSGNISIKYKVGNGTCADSLIQNINVLASPSAPTVSITNDTICDGDTVTISASGSGPSVIYNVYTDSLAGTFLGQTNLQVFPSVTTTYYVEAVGTNNCPNNGGRVPVTVVVNSLPNANAGADQNICIGDSAILLASGGGSYVWSTGATIATDTVSPAVSTTYTVVITSAQGCVNSDSLTVFVQTAGTVNAVNDNVVVVTGDMENIDVSINDLGDANSVVIITSPTNGTATILSPTVTYQSNLGYIGRDSLQYRICDVACAAICDTAWLFIQVDNDLFIPNGLSPNGDGKNDVFEILGLNKYPDNSLSIFNRWGSLIYQAEPYQNDWRGQNNQKTILGDEVVDGTYFYILKLGENLQDYNGFIELKK